MSDFDRTDYQILFWQRHHNAGLTLEHVEVLRLMLNGEFEEGISTSQYADLAECARSTASCQLAYLVEKGCLVRINSGRIVRNQLPE